MAYGGKGLSVTDDTGSERGLDDKDVVSRARACYSRSLEHLREWRDEARENFDFVAGHQWDSMTKARMVDELRPIVTFNMTGKFVDVVGGLQINNRQEVRYYPREQGDVKVNEVMTETAKWVRDRCDAEDEETEAFLDMIITGMGWTETYLDDDDDPEGNIAIERRDPLHMHFDPAARKRNLTDATWMMRIKPCTLQYIRDKWPDKAEALGDEAFWGDEEDDISDAIHNAQEAWKYNPDNDQGDASDTNRVYLVEYQWCQRQPFTRVQAQAQMGQQPKSHDFTRGEWRRVEGYLKQNGIPYKAMHGTRKVYYRAFIVGNTVIEQGKLPYQKGFTYRAVTGKRDRNSNTWYGIVRALKEPQQWTNKFFSQILHIINTNAKGGILADRNAFEHPQEAENNWARPDSVVWMNSLHDDNGKPLVVPKPVSEYPAGIDRLMQFSMSSFPEVSGINLELMGMADRVQPGIIEAHRKQSAMAIISWAFDAMRRYYRDHGRMLAHYIREFIADGRLVRITAQGSEQFIPLIRDHLTLEFDVIADEAPTSTNMKERVWLVLSEMIPQLIQTGMQIPPDVLDYTPLPSDLVEKWKELLAQPNPMQEAMAKATEAETMRIAASAQNEGAKAQTEQAKAAKTMAEAQQTAVETQKMGSVDTEKVLAEIQVLLSQVLTNQAQARNTAADAGNKMGMAREQEAG